MSDALARLPHADPERLRVRWNGRELEARRGDSMAAALYAAGHRQLALSRKFHTPRGLSGCFVAGHLANVAGLPDCRLDRTPVAPGLHARRQGTWPAPGLDLLSVARVLAGRWLGAGFVHWGWLVAPRWVPPPPLVCRKSTRHYSWRMLVLGH